MQAGREKETGRKRPREKKRERKRERTGEGSLYRYVIAAVRTDVHTVAVRTLYLTRRIEETLCREAPT